MIAEVRDDIIKLETFVAIKFKYEKYIDMLNEAGGYCFLSQFTHHYGNNEGRYIAKQLEDAGLIKTKAISNYKYCYLTDVSIRYIKLKDEDDFEDDEYKTRINVKRLSTTPSDRVLFASAIKFALMHRYKFIGKEYFEDKLVRELSELYECNFEELTRTQEDIDEQRKKIYYESQYSQSMVTNYIKPLFNLYNGDTFGEYKIIKDKIIKLEAFIEEKSKGILHIKSLKKEEDKLKELEIKFAQLGVINKFKKSLIKQKNDIEIKIRAKNDYIEKQEQEYRKSCDEVWETSGKIQNALKKAVYYYDKSKIIFMLNAKRLFLSMIIIDAGTLKNPYKYINILNKFSVETETKNLNKRIYIASYSEKRAEMLKGQFNKILIEKENKLKKLRKYNANNFSDYTPEFYVNDQKFIDKIPDFTVTVLDDAHYMQSYKDQVSSKIDYIKPKDKDRFEEIKNNLKNKTEPNKSVNKNIKKKNYKDDKKIEDDEKFLEDIINTLRN